MTASYNYITLQRQIADELGDRTDLLNPLADSNLTLSPIQTAIQAAINRWEREPFYFNDVYDEDGFSTAAGQEWYGASTAPVAYALIAQMAYLKCIHVKVNGQRYTFEVRTPEYVDRTSVNPSTSAVPIDVAYFAEQLRIYPIPDGAYPVTLQGTKRQSALVLNGDANVWTQDAYDLIRCEAKKILAGETLYDDALAARMDLAIYGDPRNPRVRSYLKDLKAEGTRRKARARITPSYF